jgi:hypothetical protein
MTLRKGAALDRGTLDAVCGRGLRHIIRGFRPCRINAAMRQKGGRMFFFWIGVMYAGALAAGLSFGKTFRHFLYGFLITLIATLPFLFFNADDPSVGKKLLFAGYEQQIISSGGAEFLKLGFITSQIVSAEALWFLIGVITVPAFWFFLLAFNCRKSSASIRMAIGSTLLAGVIFILGICFSSAAFTTLIQLFRRQPGVDFQVAGIVAAIILAGLLLIGWTIRLFRRERNDWMLPLNAAGLFAAIFAGFWLLALLAAFPYGFLMLARAEQARIKPWRMEYTAPPEIQIELDRIATYRKTHRGLELPGDSVYRWAREVPPDGKRYGDLISERDREYTLVQFDTPEMAEFLAANRRAVEILRSPNVLCAPALNTARSYARVCNGRAALYWVTGQMDKILPELSKITPLDADILCDLPMSFAQNTRLAIRNIQMAGLIRYGPDGPEYAPVYRRELERIHALPVRVPHDGGFAMQELKGALRFFIGIGTERRSPLLNILYAAPAAAYWAIMLDQSLIWAKDFESFKNAGPYGKMPTEKFRSMLVRSEAMRILLTTGLALKTYRSEKGVYPDGLAELVPGYLARLPRSSVSGEVLSYEKVGDAFNLSVPDMAEHYSWRGAYSVF